MAGPHEEQHDRPRSSMTAVFDRVQLVEREVAGMRADFAGLQQNVNNLTSVVTRMSVTLEQKSATDWKALASWATVVLAIVGLVASLVFAPLRAQIESNRADIQKVSEQHQVDVRREIDTAFERGRDRERIDAVVKRLEENRRYIDELTKQNRDLLLDLARKAP